MTDPGVRRFRHPRHGARTPRESVKKEGPFDLVLVGRNSIDADTGQVPPEIAELLGLPFAAGAKELRIEERRRDGPVRARRRMADCPRRTSCGRVDGGEALRAREGGSRGPRCGRLRSGFAACRQQTSAPGLSGSGEPDLGRLRADHGGDQAV